MHLLRVTPALAVLLLLALSGCRRGGDDPTAGAAPDADAAAAVRKTAPPDPRDIPVPQYPTGVCRIDTSEPGFMVFIDGEPARTADGDLLKTPCEVTVLRGNRTVAVAKKGYYDDSRIVSVGGRLEIDFDPQPDSSGTARGLLDAEYLDLPVGEAVPLSEVNSPGRELDPFVTADGLSIWFAGDRAEGRGVYVATRPSPLHPFGPPEFLLQTRSPDLPASPAVTQGALALVYAVPEKGRIQALTRRSPLEDFSNRTALQFTRRQAVWPSAQVLADGLKLYWREDADGGAQLFAASRSDLDRDFAAPVRIELPGGHPCLSHDGLRQYVFDGRTLRRARRTGANARFSTLETVAEVELPSYVRDKGRRQFFVSDDEQWLFYCDDPQAGGDLYLVRLFARPNWGLAPQGRPVAPRAAPAVAAHSGPDPDDEPQPSAPPVDPRTLPVPYAAHWNEFTALLAARKYDEARQRLDQSQSDRALTADRDLLDWDRDDLARIRGVLDDARQALAALEPGADLRVNNARLEFVRFADDVLTARGRTATVEKKLTELAVSDLTVLLDGSLSRDDQAAQLRIGTFLHYEPQVNERLVKLRIDRAGPAGHEFLERQAARLLRIAEREVERDNIGAAMTRVAEVRTRFPGTEAAARAEQLTQEVYKLVRWEPSGGRRWESPEEGTFAADRSRAPGSILRSSRQYENFELTLEWKAIGRTGQGGVYFRFPGGGRPGDTAWKLHLANDHGGPPDQFATGSLFKVAPPTENAVRAEGEWNELRLRVAGSRARATINGRPVLDARLTDPDIPRKGYVALDGGIGGITYRRILLIDLPAEE